eukprot:UN11573
MAEENEGRTLKRKTVKIICQIPSIKVMDARVLNNLSSCEQLSMSTNQIEKISALKLPNLKILSLSRNNIRRLQNLDGLENLQELWLSYNHIDRLDGIESYR